MGDRPLLLDLFCGAGGAAMGYHRAGFEVIGVDINPQPDYPFEFVQADALDPELTFDNDFVAVHASPPCQAHSTASGNARKAGTEYPELIGPTRELLKRLDLPYVIENVEGAPLIDPIKLCGSSFGLDVRRRRLFETNWSVGVVPPSVSWQTPRFRSLDSRMVKAGKLATVVGVHGHCQYAGEGRLRELAMGIDWMTQDELAESIPPAYTEFIGRRLIAHLEGIEALTQAAAA